jgi:hypothetical protein
MRTIIFLQVLILSGFKPLKMEVLILRELRRHSAQVLRLQTLDQKNASGLRDAGRIPALQNVENGCHCIRTNGAWESSR